MMGLPPTRRVERPTLREQLEALGRQLARKHEAPNLRFETYAIHMGWSDATIALGVDLDTGLGNVSIHVQSDAPSDWLRLAAFAAELHREAGRIINLHHRHMADLR